jgi:hypothetical protein
MPSPADLRFEGRSDDGIGRIAVIATERASKTKAKPGAKARWDWGDIEQFVWQELDKSGDFADPLVAEKGWQGFSDLYRRIIDYVEHLTGSGGEGSGLSP